MDYETLKCGTIQMLPRAEQLDEWRRDYSAMKGEMLRGSPPAFDEILTKIKMFQTEFNTA